VTQQSSIRQALTHAIVLTSLDMLVIAALFSGAIAFFEAKERQDDLLISISELVSSRQFAESEQMSDDTDEETRIVRHNTLNQRGKHHRGGRIDISLTVSNGVAQLIVDDTGPGIADGELERVFEPFNRGASAGSEGNATHSFTANL